MDTKSGHFYHGLSSIYNLKAWLEASIAGLLIGLLLGPGEPAPMCPFQLIHATMCEDSTITCDLYPQRSIDIAIHRHSLPVLQHLWGTLWFLLGPSRPCLCFYHENHLPGISSQHATRLFLFSSHSRKLLISALVNFKNDHSYSTYVVVS